MTTIRDWYSPMHFSAGLGQTKTKKTSKNDRKVLMEAHM